MQSSYTHASLSVQPLMIFTQLDSVLQEHKRHPCAYIFRLSFVYYRSLFQLHFVSANCHIASTHTRITKLIIWITGSLRLGSFGKRRGSIRTTSIWLQLRRYVIPHPHHPPEPPHSMTVWCIWRSIQEGAAVAAVERERRERDIAQRTIVHVYPLFTLGMTTQPNPYQPRIQYHTRSFCLAVILSILDSVAVPNSIATTLPDSCFHRLLWIQHCILFFFLVSCAFYYCHFLWLCGFSRTYRLLFIRYISTGVEIKSWL